MSTGAPVIDPALLEESRARCQRVTRHAARNFYYGLKLLPEPKRSAMFILYAYMRLLDDIADEDDGRNLQQRTDALADWRARTHAAMEGRLAEARRGDIWPAFAEMTQRYALPAAVFDDAIAGQVHDLEPVRFESFAQLREYCRCVAGTVALASIHIWGFEGGAQTEAMALDRGVAFQLTNVLRDLREDAGRGRFYLPRDEMAAAGVTPDDLRTGRTESGFLDFMRFQIERAQSFYEKSAGLEARISADSHPALSAMTGIYQGLLRKIAADPSRVLRQRVSLSLLTKLRIGWRALRGR